MGRQRGLGIQLIFVCAFLVAGTYTVLGDGNTSVVCSEHERLALLKFKQSVEDRSGMLSSWIGNDCCVWEGIHCDTVTRNVEILHLRGCCGTEDELEWSCYLSADEVNSSLAELRHLKHLDLSGNHFQGSQIPEFIGSLKQLTYLNLSYSYIRGNIPHDIGNLSNLRVLDLSSNAWLMANEMTWTFGLSSLEHLNLSFLNIGGAQNMNMVFYMIPSLEVLSLSDCGLSNIDIGFFLNSSRKLPKIKHLDLGFNFFEGPLPNFFRNMSSLIFLDLSLFNLTSAWNFANLLSMIPSLSELHLSDCGLDKTHLSSSLFNISTLSNIQHLDLSQNSIEGIFPSLFTNMSSLRFLDLSNNMLRSSVPIMPNLLDLDLSSNKFMRIGDVGIWRQCHLKQLHASHNHFKLEMTDSLENISECSQYALGWLDLSGSLNGIIPKPLGRLNNLRSLYLSRSSLTGSIPEFIGGLRYLEVLDLSRSRLTGPIPESLGSLRYLEVLHLSYNQLIGHIPTLIGNLSKLDLSYNRLTGSIPESIGNLTALTYLNLKCNRFTGPIPPSLGRLVSLQVVWMSENMLNGTIPVTIGQLPKLHSLDFSNNSLEGVVSEAHFSNLLMLKNLDTSYNTKLTFNVSREWIPPFQLVTLQLSVCKIANGFPQWLQNQRKLRLLVLYNASISGPLPTWLQNMPIIPVLNLAHNNLSGPLTNLPNGAIYGTYRYPYPPLLFLEYNFFNGSIPRSLCTRTDLIYLDLSKNSLTGTLPTCLENLQGLKSIILSSNKLCGAISSFKALNSLYRLKLRDNNFVGELPRELGSLPYLSILDVGDNKLYGNIPEWVGGMLNCLVVLRLHRNNFTGSFPRSLCNASNLQILDVAHNNLKGSIPHCLGVLNAMVNGSGSGHAGDSYNTDETLVQFMKGVDLEYKDTWRMVFNMDLSSNKLVGEIPYELTTLSMLVGLNLSNNHLTGGIPDNIGNMKKLESLDLSRNELAGLIPPSMADLTFLSHLNFSHNNLSGRIPTGRQLQTLIDPSIYEGNRDLCGPPLPNNCSNPKDTTPTTKKKHEAFDLLSKVWLFYLDVISGFATGFWGVIGVLSFKKQWRWNLFMFAEKMMDKIYVSVVVRVAKIKRWREAA